MYLRDLRYKLSLELKKNGIENYETDLSFIITEKLKINKTQLILGDIEVSDEEKSLLYRCIQRLIDGEPAQYITGKCEFMSLSFNVRPGVLIPRSDTEILAEAVMDRISNNDAVSVADFCCGSGCIGISLAYYMKNISVTAVDISDSALEIAKENAALNGVADRIDFLKADVTKELHNHTYDCIVSNPPYIKSSVIETLDKKVRDMEPRIALDGGADGLDFYRLITRYAKLTPGGILAFETGYDQGDAVCAILKESGFTEIELLKDLENRDRVVIGKSS